MSLSESSKQHDRLLWPFLQAQTEAEAQQRLQGLLDGHADSIIRGALQRKLLRTNFDRRYESREQVEWDELRSDIQVQLIGRLQTLRNGSDGAPVTDFRAYAAVTVYNAVSMHLRKKYPQRFSLENKLRYLLEHRQDLAIWRGSQGEWLAGLPAWRNRTAAAPGSRLQSLRENPLASARSALPQGSVPPTDPARLLTTLFEWVGQPIELDDLVGIVGELWGVKDSPPPASIEAKPSEDGRYGVAKDDALDRLDLRRYWVEIRRLLPRQCAALLLHARDPQGNSLLELLELEGVASFREMAQAMEMSPEHLAELWTGLPMEDGRIAQILNIAAQSVARMRMIARRCIAERLLSDIAA